MVNFYNLQFKIGGHFVNINTKRQKSWSRSKQLWWETDKRWIQRNGQIYNYIYYILLYISPWYLLLQLRLQLRFFDILVVLCKLNFLFGESCKVKTMINWWLNHTLDKVHLLLLRVLTILTIFLQGSCDFLLNFFLCNVVFTWICFSHWNQ